jgi:endoglucanase
VKPTVVSSSMAVGPLAPNSAWTGLTRRRALVGGALAFIGGTRVPATTMDDQGLQQWHAFCGRFVAAEGRVIDTGNHGVSHTEGQGWGLLFAEHFDDQQTFDRIASWTASNLRRPHDSLHVWRYVPRVANPTPDRNNATDGDLFIAWALARAARRWGVPAHARAAAAIAHDVLRLLTRQVDGRLLLLPAAAGFESDSAITVNPSYYVFPALTELEQVLPALAWVRLREDGLSLIDRGRFGRWMLTPDWLEVRRRGGALAPSPRWPARCSFDAIRVPLYLVWAGLTASPAAAAFAAFYDVPRGAAPPPAWVDLKTGLEASYPASPGMQAVGRIAAAASVSDGSLAKFPRIADAPDYYSAALTLLAQLAWREHELHDGEQSTPATNKNRMHP